jgi:hypothetical protein
MADIKPCLQAAKEALSHFKEADIQKYVSHVLDTMRSYKNLHGTEAMQKAIEEVNDIRMQGYLEKMQISVNDAAKVEKYSNPIKEQKKTLMELLARRASGLGDNVESSQKNAYKKLFDRSFNNFTDEEFYFLNSKENQMEICKGIDGEEVSPIAKSIADKINDIYIPYRNNEMVSSNAMPLFAINKDRLLRSIHDAGRLLRGGRSFVASALSKTKYTVSQSRDIWRSFIKEQIDLKKTFYDTDALDLNGNIDHGKVDGILNKIFDDITTGKPSLIGINGGKQEMFFYWKNMQSWMKYSEQYGSGSLMNSLRADVQASANHIGMAEILGSSPIKSYNDLAKIENEFNPQGGIKKETTKRVMNWLIGEDKASAHPTISSFFSCFRALSGSAKVIGKVAIYSVADMANGISFAHRWGHSYFDSYGTYLSGLFNALKTEDRVYVAQRFKEMTDAHLGMLSKFLEVNSTSQFVNNMNSVLYKWTLAHAMDKGNKVSALLLQSRVLADNSHLEFSGLNDQFKNMLSKFEISENEWNVIRHNTDKLNGKKLFTMDGIDRLTNEDIRKIYGINSKDVPLYQLKNDLYRKVYSMFDVAAENVVLTPGTYMKAMTTAGKSGHIWGEISRSIMQFKMYPLEFADRVLYQGFKQADGVQNKLIFGAVLMGTTLPLSWLTIYLDNLSKGRTMPKWDQMTFSEKADFSKNLLAPGLGILGNFFSERNSRENAGMFFNTPVLQTIYDSLHLPFRVANGISNDNMKEVKNAFYAVGSDVMPGTAMPFISPYMRQMFGDKPYLQSGQEQIYGA